MGLVRARGFGEPGELGVGILPHREDSRVGSSRFVAATLSPQKTRELEPMPRVENRRPAGTAPRTQKMFIGVDRSCVVARGAMRPRRAATQDGLTQCSGPPMRSTATAC